VLDTGLLQLREELLVDGKQRVEELDGLKVGRGLSGLSDKRKVGDGTEKNRSGSDTGGLGLLVLLKLLVEGELELLVGRVVDLDNVVVGVEAENEYRLLSQWGRSLTTCPSRKRRHRCPSLGPVDLDPWRSRCLEEIASGQRIARG
jgi:hypothetical protein